MRIPCVGLVPHMLAPCIERVIDHEAMPKLLMIIPKVVGQTEGDRQEAGCLRSKVEPRRVRRTNDDGDLL